MKNVRYWYCVFMETGLYNLMSDLQQKLLMINWILMCVLGKYFQFWFLLYKNTNFRVKHCLRKTIISSILLIR